MQFLLYLVGFTASALAIFQTNYVELASLSFLDGVMLCLPIIAALLGTIGTRLRQRQKFAAAKMASYEVVAEIYKFRVKAIEYDGVALAAQLAAAQSDGEEKKKKKGDEDMPKPISSKERDRVARRLFVDRVKTIYTTACASELSTGTSISHHSRFGLDPARLLREGDEDTEREMRRLLQKHVSENLYFIRNIEWEIGAEGYRAVCHRRARIQRAQRVARLRGFGSQLWLGVAGAAVNLASHAEGRVYEWGDRYRHWRMARRGEKVAGDKPPKRPAADPNDDEDPLKAAEERRRGGSHAPKTKLQELRDYFKEKGSHAAKQIDEAQALEDESKAITLDETYRIIDEDELDEPLQGGGAGGPGGSGGGTAGRLPGDTLLTTLTIDDYMLYRTRPICTYCERTAPWRAFELQFLEILIFMLNSLGAVLVGLGQTSYVPLSVAAASIVASFIDFANLSKQVEAYNTALRDLHTVINEWDGMTRTERRTRQTVGKIVNATEGSMLSVAIALTNGRPTGTNGGGGGEEEGEGGEEKEKDK